MLYYYLKLSLLNIRRAPTLYGLVLLTLAIGLGAFIANVAMINIMGQDPIPGKSHRLFHVSMNTWEGDSPGREPFDIMRYEDAKAILDANVSSRTAVTYFSIIYPRSGDAPSLTRYRSTMRSTTLDFFTMMQAPFRFGGGFSDNSANEVVLSQRLNETLFAGENSVGRSVDIQDQLLTVVGVLEDWPMRIRFYHPQSGVFDGTEDIFLPLETALNMNIYNQVQTSSSDFYDSMSDTRSRNVYFLQTWVELLTPQEQTAMQRWLDSYAQNLKDTDRHPNDILNELHNVNEWMEVQQVVDTRIVAFGIASFLFLVVCLFNASSLLLARYESGQFETALKRALGVSRNQLIAQGLVESVLVGLTSGLAALLLSWLFLQISKYFVSDLDSIAHIEGTTVLYGIAIALLTAIACMFYPLLAASRKSISGVLKG